MKKLFMVCIVLMSGKVFAEHCWMTGSCLNEVGYIVVAESHYMYADGDKSTINGKPYSVDGGDRIFVESGVPVVGETYTLNTNYYELLGTDNLDSDLQAVSRWFETNDDSEFIWNNDKSSATLELKVTQFGAGNQMEDGTEVRVLSLRLLKEELSGLTDQHLLVLVQVVKEPN